MAREVTDADGPRLVEVGEYSGEQVVTIRATQLGSDYSERRKRDVVNGWVDFFRSGPTPIRSLRFTTRTPKRLFDSLSGQHQLTSLDVKWGDYEDLSVLEGLSELQFLRLAGASKVADLSPLAQLQNVKTLQLEGLQGLVDATPLSEMQTVTNLELGGNWIAPRIVRLPSISFIARMPQLQRLVLYTLIVDDRDYAPLLSLPNLEAVRVTHARGMTPPHEELVRRLPWEG